MSAPTEQLLELTRPSRAAWFALIVVGLVLVTLSAPTVVRDLDVADPIIYLVLGAGVFLVFFALLILLTRESAVRLRLVPGAVVIDCRNGESVRLPFAAIGGVQVTAEGNGRSRVLSLQKNDGGWIELGSLPDQERAEALAKPLRAALAEQADEEATSERDGQVEPLSRLDPFRSIAYFRGPSEVSLSWGAGSPLTAFLFLGPMTGMLVIVYGFHRYSGGIGTIIAMAFVATLGLVLVIFVVINMGVTQRLRLDGRHLDVERLRFGRVLKRQQLQLTAIAAVDYSHRLSVTGAGLTLRSGQGQQAQGEAMAMLRDAQETLDEDDEGAAAAVVATALMKRLGSGVHVPLGKLSLAAKIALDLALSEEIARRVGKAAGRL